MSEQRNVIQSIGFMLLRDKMTAGGGWMGPGVGVGGREGSVMIILSEVGRA